MWLAVGGGAVVTVGMSFILFMDKPFPQYVMTSVFAGLIGVLLYLMTVLNHAFQGPLAIEPEAFESSLKLFDSIDEDFKDPEYKKEPTEHKAEEHKEETHHAN